MRFTFQEEKNSDSRDSNHNTLTEEKPSASLNNCGVSLCTASKT